MHSEWSAEHGTRPTAPTPPAWGSPSGGAAVPERDDVAVPERDDAAVPTPEGPPSGQGEGPEAEEELHRSAVDAVDGLLDEVELALARLDDGTYGRCEGCGTPIDDDRLAGRPIVRTCGRCDEVDGGTPAVDPAAPITA